MTLSRRTLLKLAGLSPAAKIAGIQLASAEDRDFRHALTLFSDIKYGPDFKHFRLCEPGRAEEAAACASASSAPSTASIPIPSRASPGGAVVNDTLLVSSLDEALDRIWSGGERRVAPRGPLAWWSIACGPRRASMTASR